MTIWRTICCASALALYTTSACATPLTGELGAHDPSSLAKDGANFIYYATGQGIVTRTSTNLTAWSAAAPVFNSPPAWTTVAVPSFTGVFWAPDVAYFNGKYHLYYSVSEFGTIDSAIGVATSPSLSTPTWTDQGKVVQSDAVGFTSPQTDTTAYNAIDPSVLVDTDGKVWMAFGSYSSGILVTELNPTTGKRLNTASLAATQVANNAAGGGWGSTIEGAELTKRGAYYYMFVNYGGCCAGVDSTYEVRVGRSTSPTGPFVDQNGVDLRNSGGKFFLEDDGKRLGPGHIGVFSEAGQDYFGYHYYNGDFNGAPTYQVEPLHWTTDLWPSYADVNPDWRGATNSNWTTTTNWSADGVPNSVGAVANFAANNFSRYTVALDGGAMTVGTVNFRGTTNYTVGATSGSGLTLDAATGEMATLNAASGSHTLAAPLTASDRLGVNVSPAATLTASGAVTAPGLTKYGHGTLVLSGTNAYAGTMFVKRGVLDIRGATSATQFVSIGQTAGDNGTLIVRGAGQFNSTADLNIGDSGDAITAATGVLELRDSATVTVGAAGAFIVGSGFSANTRGVGTVNQTGGTLTANGNFDGAFIIGGRGSSLGVGTYNLSGGAVNANTNMRVGGYGTGTVNQTGGAFTSNSFVAIGRFAGATGAWNISAGSLNVNNAARWLLVGESGTGTLNITGSGQVTTANVIRIGHAGGAGTITLSGGTLTTLGLQRGTGTATINFNGGVLSPTTSSTTFMQGLTTAKVQAGGAMLDTSGRNITIAQALIHDAALGATLDGGLTKQGLGTLTLSAANTYTGSTAINAGALTLTGSVASPVTVNSGGTLQGAGTIGGFTTIASGGAVAPGNGAIGTLRTAGITWQSGSTSRFEIGGTGTLYDRIQATGIAQINGALEVTLLGGFIPNIGDSFGFLFASGGFGGTFSSLNLPSLGAGKGWQLNPGGSTVFLNVVATILPGDYNADGLVDAADYTTYRDALGTNTVLPNDTTPGSVTNDDYAVWQANFGAGAPSAAAAVPEPAGSVRLIALLLLFTARNRAAGYRQYLSM